MSVKKIVALGAAAVAAVGVTSAMAGGYMPVAPAVVDNGYYFEGHLGYARQNYLENTLYRRVTGVATNHNSNVSGGFASGVDMGYKINRNFAVELGWFHLPSVSIRPDGQSRSYLNSWALYLAAKYMMPVMHSASTDLFFKLGVMYRHAKVGSSVPNTAVPTTTFTKTKSDFVRPMFAVGIDQSLSSDLSFVLQYAYFMGARNSFPVSVGTTAVGPLGTVAANVFTAGFGYKFTV